MKRVTFFLTSLLLFILIVAACVAAPVVGPAGAGTPAAAEAATQAPVAGTSSAGGTAGRCGDKSKLSKSVSFYNWSDYIDPDILKKFEAECGVKVVYDTYSSNEDLLAKLQGGATGYDLIVPSDYMITIMRKLDLLKELDHNNIPNLANLAERFHNAPYDPGNKFSVPYQWGTTGIGYDLDKVGTAPDSLGVLFDPKQVAQYKGKMSLLNDEREVIGAALKYLGYSMNSTDPKQLDEAKQVILGVKPYVKTFDSETYADLLVSGDTIIVHGWSGDIYKAIFDNTDRHLGFAIPKEGDTIFTDNMAIPKSAPNPYTAEVLINYLLDPEIGAMITNFTNYASPNQAAEPNISEDIKNDPGIYPPQAVLDKMEFLTDVGDATQLYDRIWTEIKAQQ